MWLEKAKAEKASLTSADFNRILFPNVSYLVMTIHACRRVSELKSKSEFRKSYVCLLHLE